MLKTLTPYRICRCNFCNWRGTLSLFKIHGARLAITATVSAGALLAGGLALIKYLGI